MREGSDTACEPAELSRQPRQPPREADQHGARGRLGVGVALLLSAFSLRPALASVGALLGEIRDGLGMDATLAGALTAVPSACFAAAGVAAVRLSRWKGPGAVLAAAMAVLTLGLLGRAVAAGLVLFLLCSTAAVAGIGVGNVVMPAAVRRYFPDRIGLVTGLYSTSLTAGAALAAAVSVPAAELAGGRWRFGLGVWAVPAAAAALAWLALPRRREVVAGQPAGPRTSPRDRPAPLLRSRTAWALSLFFGLQAAGAYIVLGWLPQILRDAGVPPGRAGLWLAMTPAVGIPLAFLVPALAARARSQGGVAVALGLLGLTGYAGLWFAPAAAPWLWASLLGVSQASFPLALTMIGLRANSTGGVARLSAFAQGIGYLIATPGPLLVGALYQHTHGWHAPLAFMAALLLPQTIAGMLAGRSGAR